MTAPTEDLIARLERKGYTRAMCDTQEPINPDGPEAAQALRALQQEVERLRGDLSSIESASNPDTPDSYRADDREGALDYIHATAEAALTGSAD